MGREVRRVPANWEHPKDSQGRYIGLSDLSFTKMLEEYHEAKALWEQGLRKNYSGETIPVEPDDSFEDWYEEEQPRAEDFMPEWPEHERTHLMMYETCSEGTPISPVFEKPEDLAHWLADNNASAFGNMTASYDEWLATINCGFAPSMVLTGGGTLMSGVQASIDFAKTPEHLCPHCRREMVESIIGADCAGGSHREIDGWYCEPCDYSEPKDK
ncbi:hypothetical protein LJC15_04215 [Desulfovibrio sp. OttesenSCG-928-G11]|nr:hypothetical protein [Desulfovibrio sp. OttesenSCG-928-G11]